MVLDSPQWGGFHPFVAEWEETFAAFQHSAYGISAFNGTVTLEIALSALGIGPGDEVIVPAVSFVSSATSISRAGAVPVFVDIDPCTLNIDPEAIKRVITSSTKAIMAVHFGGNMCDMAALHAICREYNLYLIEDAAHAHGSEWEGKRAGSFGITGSFSFQNGKVLSAGEGGMLVTSDESFAAQARSLANCGRLPGRSFYEHYNLGTNLRLTAFQAAVLIAQFERLPQQIRTRSGNAALLKASLGDLREISWQSAHPQTTANSVYLLIGRVTGGAPVRSRVCQALAAKNIPCTPFYPWPLYRNEVFRNVPCRVAPCPVAEAAVEDAFWLPHRVLLAEPEVVEIAANAIRAAI
jgi:dTDP-4-amino-4,6-dideoxygalactose transaminase